ncbi:MAG: hypothetical protein IKD80_02400 [Selenomonadaceae bacterium]|nr:hypothetical protein [Selenomonadaceae bacterium]
MSFAENVVAERIQNHARNQHANQQVAHCNQPPFVLKIPPALDTILHVQAEGGNAMAVTEDFLERP